MSDALFFGKTYFLFSGPPLYTFEYHFLLRVVIFCLEFDDTVCRYAETSNLDEFTGPELPLFIERFVISVL